MTLRPWAALGCVATALLAVGPATAAAGTPALMTTVTQLGKSTVELSCAAASSASCHYLFLSSLCQERFLANGVKERACRYMEATPPFQIRPGERKTVTDLPADFIYTMKLGAAPTADECLRSPIPH
ncbi:hypothetical protein [Pseudoduganella armeniaca]|nr:hypothetical protein [Pseudoduganella armeniaca]